MNVQATVGDRVKFGMNYDTESTFDFDKQNIKLGYEGKEDDWLKSIDVGNVSMNLNSALIPGASSLFGIKSNMQFGKLKVSALASQQRRAAPSRPRFPAGRSPRECTPNTARCRIPCRGRPSRTAEARGVSPIPGFCPDAPDPSVSA